MHSKVLNIVFGFLQMTQYTSLPYSLCMRIALIKVNNTANNMDDEPYVLGL